MSVAKKYDLLAGTTAAMEARKRGKRVALFEEHQFGGTCLNYGCDPTKTLLHIAAQFYRCQRLDHFGIDVTSARADWQTIRSYVQTVVNQMRGGDTEEACQKLNEQGLDVFLGRAVFRSPTEVMLNDDLFEAERIIIASGSETLIPDVPGLKAEGFLTNKEAIWLPELPERLAIAGAGAIGVEFAQMFARFGVQVTLIERHSTILDKEDPELAALLCSLLQAEGIRILTSSELVQVEGENDGCKLLTVRSLSEQSKATEALEVDELLLALGRGPNVSHLRLERAGVEVGKKGIVVDQTLCTTCPHIWAAGDVVGQFQFTHMASEQGKLVVHNAFSNGPRAFDAQTAPWVTFTDPPLAHAGLTEEQLRAQHQHYRVGCFSFSENERAMTSGEIQGLVKLFVDDHYKILGGHILGPRADELISTIIMAMRAGTTVDVLADTIFPYPTLSEGLRLAAANALE